ncbi:MAG TPA: hypothetical protein VM347_11440 [Nonomuraea sp.]|nr:hypothetical protein [Nonomuraea sp.]
MKICTVRPGLPFPHAAQAIQVKRRRTDLPDRLDRHRRRYRSHPADGLQLVGLTT